MTRPEIQKKLAQVRSEKVTVAVHRNGLRSKSQ